MSTSEEDGVILIGFADDEASPDHYVLLQRTLAASARDRELGHEAVHLEIDGEQCSCYGQILEAVFDDDSLLLVLSENRASDLGIDDGIHVSISSLVEQRANLAEWLGRLIGVERVRIAESGDDS